jgi:hypothetical protein
MFQEKYHEQTERQQGCLDMTDPAVEVVTKSKAQRMIAAKATCVGGEAGCHTS